MTLFSCFRVFRDGKHVLTTCLEKLKIDTNCWEVRRQSGALGQNVGALRETRQNEAAIKWVRELRQECNRFQVSEQQCAGARDGETETEKGGGKPVNQATVCGRAICCFSPLSQRQNAEPYPSGLQGIRDIASEFLWFSSIARTRYCHIENTLHCVYDSLLLSHRPCKNVS